MPNFCGEEKMAKYLSLSPVLKLLFHKGRKVGKKRHFPNSSCVVSFEVLRSSVITAKECLYFLLATISSLNNFDPLLPVLIIIYWHYWVSVGQFVSSLKKFSKTSKY